MSPCSALVAGGAPECGYYIWSRRQKGHGKAGSENAVLISLSYRRYSAASCCLYSSRTVHQKLVACSRSRGATVIGRFRPASFRAGG